MRTFFELIVSAFPLLGLTLAMAAVATSVIHLNRKRNAETELIRMLELKLRHEHRLRRLQIETAKFDSSESMERVLAIYSEYLENAVKKLPPDQRVKIEEGLHQPSQKGRESYVKKLYSSYESMLERGHAPV